MTEAQKSIWAKFTIMVAACGLIIDRIWPRDDSTVFPMCIFFLIGAITLIPKGAEAE